MIEVIIGGKQAQNQSLESFVDGGRRSEDSLDVVMPISRQTSALNANSQLR